MRVWPNISETLEKAEAEITDLLEYQRTLMNAQPELDDRVFVLQCWSPIPEEELVGKLGNDFTFTHYSEEPEEWDRMPVLMKNPPAFESGEDLVKIYSYPSHKDFDPSPFVLYCFAVFFGMIIGDLGYGLILLGMTFWITRKVKSRSPLAVRMFRLMYLLCASVIFFGIIGAGFFGIQLDPNNPWVKHAWFDYSTMEGQNDVMVISILIGMVHISLSMLIKLYNDRDYGAPGWVIAIWSAYFLLNSKMAHGVDNPTAMYGLIAGLAVVLLFSSKNKNPAASARRRGAGPAGHHTGLRRRAFVPAALRPGGCDGLHRADLQHPGRGRGRQCARPRRRFRRLDPLGRPRSQHRPGDHGWRDPWAQAQLSGMVSLVF